jgi:two-component system, sensor histidine kinase RegB
MGKATEWGDKGIMFSPAPNLIPFETRSDWVRLRTLILLRWTAVVGQIAAIGFASLAYGMQLPLIPCFLVIATSVVANIIAIYVFPENRRLTEQQALLMLLFDLAQLSFLIFLTGGLTNPFALLVLAPVTISASALSLRTTVWLGGIAILLITINAFVNFPLRYADGSIFAVPSLFAFGFWLSIVIGILFLALYSRRVAIEIHSMSDALLATQMALAREQKLTDLGGVVAAAAHELGTPLATIKLTSTELMRELSDHPDLKNDAQLIRDQADRCRDILRSMGRAGKDDRHLHQAPLGALLREAAEPHSGRGKTLIFSLAPGPRGGAREPTILRSPEVIHGLRNLIQNGVDFARSTVWIDGEWTDRSVLIRIADDGTGYPPHLFGRIGDPFVGRQRSKADRRRKGYEGMGLGLFIAKTLLERSGASIGFANGAEEASAPGEATQKSGAIVECLWPLERLVVPRDRPLGENKRILR